MTEKTPTIEELRVAAEGFKNQGYNRLEGNSLAWMFRQLVERIAALEAQRPERKRR